MSWHRPRALASHLSALAARALGRRRRGTVVRMRRSLEGPLPQHPMPDGYTLRTMRRDEVDVWVDIQLDADETTRADLATFRREFGEPLEKVERRIFFALDSEGTPVATIAAWIGTDSDGGECGQMHWLAVRPAHGRRGLARALSAHVVRELARRHDRCFLVTNSRLTAAIRIYLTDGWVPDLDAADAERAWVGIRSDLAEFEGSR